MSCDYSPYNLPSIDFVGGASEDFAFRTYFDKEKSTPFDLFGAQANFSIASYLNKTGKPIISKQMEIRYSEEAKEHNILAVSLAPNETVNLSGKYVYQITIKDVDGNIDIPYQGIIFIHNNINRDYI